MAMNRRCFIQTTGFSLASLVINDAIAGQFSSSDAKLLLSFPNSVKAVINGQPAVFQTNDNQTWKFNDATIKLKKTSDSILISMAAPDVQLTEATFQWELPVPANSKILNDHWERTYGDVSWHQTNTTQILPWYFFENHNGSTNGFGVKTGASAFCYWSITNSALQLTLDTRTGGSGVQLGNRILNAAEIVTIKSKQGESAFQTTRRFMKKMCANPRMPNQPVYGINDWYFSYGVNSEKLIIEHTQMMAPFAEELSNRPFSLIDAGWFVNPPSAKDDCCWGDTMDEPDGNFGDMGKLAAKIKKTGMRPGIWTRPLCGSYKSPASLMLPQIKGREENKPVLDPTIPENLEKIKNYFKLYNEWGYEMVKFDFTTFDIFGKWGFEMLQDLSMTQANWVMNDTSKTNAEIILNLYTAIRQSAGNMYVLGCNTISHLSAGLFELNRIGDDTSGKEWNRTKKMGVNTLAFRGVQHGTFYAADSDCVGLTNKVSWEKNKQWMELVAKSGTPLFISAQTNAVGAAQKRSIKECFRLASKNLPLGEPLDWLENSLPQKWKLNGQVQSFNWD